MGACIRHGRPRGPPRGACELLRGVADPGLLPGRDALPPDLRLRRGILLPGEPGEEAGLLLRLPLHGVGPRLVLNFLPGRRRALPVHPPRSDAARGRRRRGRLRRRRLVLRRSDGRPSLLQASRHGPHGGEGVQGQGGRRPGERQLGRPVPDAGGGPGPDLRRPHRRHAHPRRRPLLRDGRRQPVHRHLRHVRPGNRLLPSPDEPAPRGRPAAGGRRR
mmetsp:Transcript_78291/g.217403  ORF Transcript_78291/g.217403 Transcript_78291/m.217403 type:complete len:218 (+) Transcript_78291:712-1365(+)